MEPNLNTSKSPSESNKSFVSSSPLSEKLSFRQIQQLIENYSEPEKARKFLENAGIVDKDGNLMPYYQPITKDDAPWLDCMDAFECSESSKKTENKIDEWQAEGYARLFF